MNPFFNTPEKRRTLVLEAQDWVGTPFMAQGRQKHFGADCVGLVAGIYRATGFLETFDPPRYSVRGLWAVLYPIFEGYLDKLGTLQPVWTRDHTEPYRPFTGDMLTFRWRGLHSAIVLDRDKFLHAFPNDNVGTSRLFDPTYQRILWRVYRPVSESK
jgi:cell wall-associated NlpC family hydrolase